MEHMIGIPSTVEEIELSYKTVVKASERITVSSASQAYRIFYQYWNPGHIELLESFKLLLLNTRCQVLGIIDLSKGSTSAAIIDPRLIFAAALKANAKQIILAHNHPGGNLAPSKQDINATEKLVKGAKLLDLIIADHLILTADHYFSFADEGLL